MGQIILANRKSIKGPWLLDNKSLSELAITLGKINDILEQENEKAILFEAEQRREQNKDKFISVEQSITYVRTNFSQFQTKRYNVVLFSDNNKRLEDKELLELLKDPKLDDINPNRLNIEIDRGLSHFSLDINTKLFGELEVYIYTKDDIVTNEIRYELNQWIEIYSPKKVVQIWTNVVRPLAPYILFFFIWIFGSMLGTMTTTPKSNYDEVLKVEAAQLIKKGITSENSNKAIELLLKIQSGYTPIDYKPIPITADVACKNLLIDQHLLWVFIGLIILSISPKTTIGIGKRKNKYNFYKAWIYIVLFSIPNLIILPMVKKYIFK